jgi:hypothetical protein
MKRFALALSAIVVGLVVSSCAVGVREPATEITTTSAVLNGKVLSSTGGPGSWYIEYGPTEARTEKTPTRAIDFVVGELEPVSEPIDGLEPGTIYHFAVCAEDSENPGEPFCSPDRTFRTVSIRDSVVARGSSVSGFTITNVDVDVSSGPSGENPTGHAAADVSGVGHLQSSSITCLSVSGNSANIAGSLEPNSAGYAGFFATVLDLGPANSGQDRFGAVGGSNVPTNCSGPIGTGNLNGDGAVVLDAP